VYSGSAGHWLQWQLVAARAAFKLPVAVVVEEAPRPDPEIPNSRSPDSRFGRESGIPAGNRGFPPGIPAGNRGGNPRFPPGIGEGIPDSRFGRKSGNRGYSSHVSSTKHDPGAKCCLQMILENADFRPPTHVSSGCQWLVASSVRQRPKSPIPVPPIPDLAGNRGGNPRFPIRPKSGIRESPIPDSAGTGSRGPDGGGPGISWSPGPRRSSGELVPP
jgi:hypothetical protein